MDAGDRAELEALMARMAGGDTVAVFTFLDAYRERLAATVRRLITPYGRRDVLRDPAQIDALVQAAAFAIFDNASGWSADGALPWTWAERAIRAEIVAWIGHPCDELPLDAADDRVAGPSPTAGPRHGRATVFALDGGPHNSIDLCALQPDRRWDEFAYLAGREPLVALLWAAIRLVASPRDTEVHIQYRVQKGLGDRSPAHTVGAEFGLAPDNVRQIDHRVRRKLGALIERNDTFGPLRELHWLAS